MVGLGTLANAAAIVVGGAMGTYVIPKVPENVRDTVMKALGLSVILMGLQMAWATKEFLLIILSLAGGAVVGELVNVEGRLTSLTGRLEKVMGKQSGDFTANFVRITLLFCVGAMAITGSFQDGLHGDASILFAKAILDGVGAVVFSSMMGPAVILTAVPVLLYQGALTLGASALAGAMTPAMINELASCGGILVMAIGLNLLEVVRVRVGNLLPALLIIPLLVGVKSWVLTLLHL